MNILDYCKLLLEESKANPQILAKLIKEASQSESTEERAFAWALYQNAAKHQYSEKGWDRAAELVLEMYNLPEGTEPPEAS